MALYNHYLLGSSLHLQQAGVIPILQTGKPRFRVCGPGSHTLCKSEREFELCGSQSLTLYCLDSRNYWVFLGKPDCLAVSRLPLRKPLSLLPWTWCNFKEISALPSEFDILCIIWSWATIHPSWVRGPGALVCSQLGQLDAFLGLPCGSDGKEFACNAGDLGLTLGLGRSPGEGNGKPLQYSCLENSIRGAWWATIHGVTKSQTKLSDFHLLREVGHLPWV